MAADSAEAGAGGGANSQGRYYIIMHRHTETACRRSTTTLFSSITMPMKYSHVKKRAAAAGSPRKTSNKSNDKFPFSGGHAHRNPNPHLDRSITQAVTAVSELEYAISRILLLRYEQDIARLYSTRLHNIALVYLPKLVLDCVDVSSSPGWVAANADCDEIRDFFRSAIAMDMRQAGERVATKSVLWSYTALRHFVRAFRLSALFGVC